MVHRSRILEYSGKTSLNSERNQTYFLAQRSTIWRSNIVRIVRIYKFLSFLEQLRMRNVRGQVSEGKETSGRRKPESLGELL